MSLNERLRDLRERRGLSGRAAATYLKISSAHVSDLENGRANPSLELLLRLASYYHTSTDYLLGLTDDPQPRESEPLPRYADELLSVLGVLSDERRLELLAHAQVLLESEKRASNTQKLQIMLDMVQAVGGDDAMERVLEVLQLAATDLTAARARADELFGGPDVPVERRRPARKDAAKDAGQHV